VADFQSDTHPSLQIGSESMKTKTMNNESMKTKNIDLNNNSLQFVYNHTGSLTGIVNCTLYLDGNPVNYSMDVPANTSQSVYSNQSWSEGDHYWYVNCTNGTSQESSLDIGQNYTFTADFTPPNITSWYANATNASSTQDLMFLVGINESVLFDITVNESNLDSFVWLVSKIDQNNNAPNFTFNVPECDHNDPSSCIWEIHVIVNDSAGNEAHQEWVVSNLSIDESPEFFDYFTDKKSYNRTKKDPWGRELPNWTLYPYIYPPASKGFAENYAYAGVSSNITVGTWIFRYRFPEKNTGAWGLNFQYIGDYAYYSKCADTHHHCGIKSGPDSPHYFSYEYDASGVTEDGKWHTVRIVRTKDGWIYTWKDNYFDMYVYDPRNISTTYMRLQLPSHADDSLYFDNLMVWENQEIFPEKKIEYKEYIWNYYEDPSSYYYIPMNKTGIIVRGRGIRLEEIYNAINNNSLFGYNLTTKTAICHTNLVVDEGSELIIEDEILKFDSQYDAGLELVMEYGSTLRIINSTITSNNEYYWVWNNAGSTTHYGNEVRLTHPGRYGKLYNQMSPEHSCYCNLIVKDSIINNTAHMFFDSPYGIEIKNSKIMNLHEIDIGNYTVKGSYSTQEKTARSIAKGNKSFWLYTDEMAVHEFNIDNLTIGSANNTIVFMINVHKDKLNVYNVDFGNTAVVVKESATQPIGQSHTCYCDQAPYEWRNSTYPGYLDSGLNLINCKFNELNLTPVIYTDFNDDPVDKYAVVKYYLDVFVEDKNHNPVQNATIYLINEVDNNNHLAENLVTKRVYTGHTDYDCFYHIYRLIEGEKLNHTYTLSNGHTPKPDDKNNTVVIADYKKILMKSYDGIMLKWNLMHTWYWVFCVDIYDDFHGNIFHKCYKMDNSIFYANTTHKVNVTYDKTNKSIRVILKNETNDTIFDSQTIPLEVNITPFNFNQIWFEVANYHRSDSPREITWESSTKNIKLYTKAYRGEIEAYLDNLSISGYSNDYSTNPNLSNISDSKKFHSITSTDGNSFIWTFDLNFKIVDADGPWLMVGLKDSNSETETLEPHIIQYIYTITANKTTDKGKVILKNTTNTIYPNGTIYYSENKTFSGIVTGVNPNESWYRPNPLIPTYTVNITLNKSVNAVNHDNYHYLAV